MPDRITFQPGTDRPLAGIPRVDCLCDMLHDLTARDFGALLLVEWPEYLGGLCLLLGALPDARMATRTAWARAIASRVARVHGVGHSETLVALADNVVAVATAWAREKRTRYPLPASPPPSPSPLKGEGQWIPSPLEGEGKGQFIPSPLEGEGQGEGGS